MNINELLILTRPLFVLDTETTGVDPKSDRIVEIGFQRWETTGITKEWRSHVNPTVTIPPSSTKVHGITDARVAGSLSFKDLAANLAKGFSACDYAGKNIRFDLRIIAAEMQRAGQEWSYIGARIVDVERLEQLAIPRDLGSLHKKYTGAKHEGAHGALSDVRASTTVICKQLEAHASLPRDLDILHAKQWPGWIDGDGKFRFVDGVPCFSQWGKYAGQPMTKADIGYWDFIIKGTFGEDVKALARAAKLGQFPKETQ